MAVKDKSVQIVVSAEVKKVLDAFDSAGKGITKFGAETERIGKAIDGAFAPLIAILIRLSGPKPQASAATVLMGSAR